MVPRCTTDGIKGKTGCDERPSIAGLRAATFRIAPPAGLVSWWAGDRTAEDVQGTNPGVLQNGASFKKGIVGPAFSFDGVDDYVKIPHNTNLNPVTGDFSVDFWMNTDTSGFNVALLNKRDGCGPNSFWDIFMDPDGLLAVALFQSGDVNANLFLSDIPVNDGTWHHVALVRQTTTATLYIDGAVHGSGSTEGVTIVANTAPVRFANDECVGIGREFYAGELDEIQYLNVALTSSQVQDIYNAGADGQCKPNIFVASIDPSYTVSGHGFRISTSTVIQDFNGVGINNATVQLGVILPSGSTLTFPLKTDMTGQADVTFTAADSGLYQFKVRKVNHPIREYDASLNIETSDTLVIP